jgi:glycosyltransferase involved in cell wall biosynthesis
MDGKKLMRIVYVSQFPNMVGGGEHSLLDLMSHLPKAIEPILITPSVGIFPDKAAKCDIKHQILPMPPLKSARFSVFSKWRKALKLLNPDVIHANNSRAAFYAGIAAKTLGIPVIFHCRISDPDGLMDKILVRLVSSVICNSQAVASRFQDFSVPTHVIYNGIHLHPMPDLINPLPSAERYMLFVGRLTEEKQLEHALKVFAELATADQGLHFVIVGDSGSEGDSSYVQNLKDWVEQQPWASRVHWLGYCDNIEKWYVHAKVLVLTSKHEGFGRVLVEAMAQSCPVVAYAVGGVPEVFEDGKQGFLIAPNDIQAMVEVCQRLLEDDDLNAAMGKAGVKQAQHFSIEKHVHEVVAVYQGLKDKVEGAGHG